MRHSMLVLFIAVFTTSCDPAEEMIYVNNRSGVPVEIDMPEYLPGPSHGILPHTSGFAAGPGFGLPNPLDVQFRDARTHLLLTERVYTNDELENLSSGNSLTLNYPP